MTAVAEAPAPEIAAPRRRLCWFSYLVLVAAAAWLVFTVLHDLLSGRYWLWLMVDLAPPLLYLLVPAALLLVIAPPRLGRRRLRPGLRWSVGLMSIAALALGISSSGLNVFGHGDGPAPADALRVVSWNTDLWSQDKDPATFYAFLKAQNADVYLLQEHMHWDLSKGEQGATAVGERTRLEQAFPGYHIVMRSELVTLSRFPIVATPRVAPDRDGPDPEFTALYQQDKVLRTDIQVGSRVMSFYNTHISVQLSMIQSPFDAFFWQYVRHRFDQRGEQYRGLEADVAANHNPSLIAGDFNTTAAMRDIDGMKAVATDAARASSSLYPTSWNGETPLRWWRLDWTFTTPGVRVHSYDLDNSAPSDHAMQHVVVSLAGS
ncbi:endonuclease/exonuclease/phosphatase family protein [Kutzneria chonburiensis]|uniref:Endonuclease/exonuclease/phosphatase family protein n=1 Tax=Kutzneria chonburiensis TaxID=1483604 RepID=A0ABV6N4G3_9PSEU|nr:endonuclease/exonuclease/phosphatase family protein [Kutzneria chonburiensis]